MTNPNDRLEAAAERFADVMHEAIAARVRFSLAAERDRHDAEIAELRDELHTAAAEWRNALGGLPRKADSSLDTEAMRAEIAELTAHSVRAAEYGDAAERYGVDEG